MAYGHSLEMDLLYFDTTSTYFEIEADDNESFRRHGYSRDRRPDRPQAVIGLAVTRDGTPVRSWVWPGNTLDLSVIAVDAVCLGNSGRHWPKVGISVRF